MTLTHVGEQWLDTKEAKRSAREEPIADETGQQRSGN
jgi:hypothetical protein